MVPEVSGRCVVGLLIALCLFCGSPLAVGVVKDAAYVRGCHGVGLILPNYSAFFFSLIDTCGWILLLGDRNLSLLPIVRIIGGGE